MSTSTSTPLVMVMMGVSGTGKSSVGVLLAEALEVDFIEGDAHHPPANITKMSDGVPLTDEDRRPWLLQLARLTAREYDAGRSVVLTCSALKRDYRDLLRSGVPDDRVFFVHLHADTAVLTERMQQRTKHFMPASLLASQLDTLEPLEPDETGALVDVTPPLSDIAAEALSLVTPLLSPTGAP